MDQALFTHLAPPRIENGKPLLIAGLSQRYTSQTRAGIPAQWKRFQSHLGNIPGQLGGTTYGVLRNTDDAGNTEYITGVEVADLNKVPPDLARVRLPEQKYAVFSSHEHISNIHQVWSTIWSKGLTESGFKSAGGAAFERYGPEFDPATRSGGFEIWVPIQ